MADIESIRRSIKETLDEEERVREEAYRSSRDLIKICRDRISTLVQGGKIDEDELLKDAEEIIQGVRDGRISRYPFIEDSLTELAEAILLSRMVRGIEMPMPEEVGLTERAYSLGACDAIGELRRIALNRLLNNDPDGALMSYERMKDLFSLVEGLIYPSGMIQLKRKQDAARASLDRTLGEITVALSGMRARR